VDKGVLQLVFQLSIRSLWSHRVKNLVVGSIIFIGVFLLVTANAMLDSVSKGMESSITASITGHLQLYDKDAQDQLSMMGMMGNFLSKPHIGHVADFQTLRNEIEQHPNVKALIPMGTDTTIVYGGNRIDRAATELRHALKQLPPALTAKEKQQHLHSHIQRLRDLIEHLHREYQLIIEFSGKQTKTAQALADLKQARSAVFWQELILEPGPKLQFLETRIAPLMDDENPVFMEVLGTDLDRFKDAFPRFKIVKGSMVPSGQRGVLVNDTQYEKAIKDRIARVFDRVWEKRHEENVFIKDDKELRQYIERRAKEYKQWLLSFDSGARLDIQHALQTFLNAPEANLDTLIPEFLALNDENFLPRYEFFYAHVAPKLDLYPIDIGDKITLRKFGEGESQQVIFYGTYQFEGAEKSGFSALFHLVDMTTFRDLYGFMTEEKQIEINKLKKEFSTVEWGRTSVEDELFSSEEGLIAEISFDAEEEKPITEIILAPDQNASRAEQQALRLTKRSNQTEIDQGAVLSASVVLHDETLIKESRKEIETIIRNKSLPVQVIDWQKASGYVGQMISVMKIILMIFIVFVFLVSMVVVNNAMLMSTINRYGEIGTLRAIGAGRSVIMGIFLLESTLLTLVAAILGAVAGIITVKYFHVIGIAAPRYEFYFLFGGPRLFPDIDINDLYLGPLVILAVSLLATFYPALLATRVPPVIAMNARE
jgi:ABC-type lipoprotein release transport system permease subunit